MADPIADPARDALQTLDAELVRGRTLFAAATSLDMLEEAETAVLGRRSAFSAVQRGLRELSDAERRTVGTRTHEVRQALQALHQERRRTLEAEHETAMLEADRLDVTLPGRRPRLGSLHPLTLTEYQLVETFVRMGYRVVEGPEIENDWYNFQALNIPPDHPARTMKDTFYLDAPGGPELLLRTETSAMQIRTMESQQPPIYIVSPGRVYRKETSDATHSAAFHQLEGLAIDEGLTLADLKGTLETFAREVFGAQQIRLTPSYFPFVEPGAQVEVSCFVCGGSGEGCRTCKQTGWIELLGCGMVHPAVLENVGYDPERYTGFAFGLGIDRAAMLRYGLTDIRGLFDGDLRLLEQFEGVA
jgi:phenylalanyl-tRNA synthetase alpha chain